MNSSQPASYQPQILPVDGDHVEVEAFVSIHVDRAAGPAAVRAAIDGLPVPLGVLKIVLVETTIAQTFFDCRVVVDLMGNFDERTEGLAIARHYARDLSRALGVPAFALRDLLLPDSPDRFGQ